MPLRGLYILTPLPENGIMESVKAMGAEPAIRKIEEVNRC
jgi:hypothetical protein